MDNYNPSNEVDIITIYLSRENFYENFADQLKRQPPPETPFRLIISDEQTSNTKIDSKIRKIRFGISSRNRKIFSKPMIEILYRLCACLFLDIIIFPDAVVRNCDVEKWPIVNVFLCFFAKGYPINKALDYVKLRRPIVINNVASQKLLFNRKKIYKILTKNKILVPNYFVVERDNVTNSLEGNNELIEDGDSLIFGNNKLTKPFVEKPLDAENHNITIYFPAAIGGGCQKLFRKMGNRSSLYCHQDKVRRNGSFIYEEFILTDGADVKVYCVGKDYAYAEARKSPALDGKVERDFAGKEMRYPIILVSSEKLISRTVVEIFKQDVCGIDMLRAGNKCYVCDVNGFSFVKKSTKYYDDCAHMIVGLILTRTRLNFSLANPLKNPSKGRSKSTQSSKSSTLELVSVVAVIRHGDRTPKQKMKMVTRHLLFHKLFTSHEGNHEACVKLKKASELQEVLDVTNDLVSDPSTIENYEEFDNPVKLFQMKYVLEMYGEFMGVNRKVQIRSLADPRNRIIEQKFRSMHPDRSLPMKFSEHSLLVILKWGGELTEVGRIEAEEFGHRFSRLYPREPLVPSSDSFLADTKFSKGLLRLHSTYRHNMKIFASDEGRVQLTAAAFAKGMLALEGQLASTLAHLVQCDKQTTRMLDASNQVEYKLLEVKRHLHEKLSVNRSFDRNTLSLLATSNQTYVLKQLMEMENPYQACIQIHELVKTVHKEVAALFNIDSHTKYLNLNSNPSETNYLLCHGETPELMERRWGKLKRDFQIKNGTYDISLVPDIYDSARYDYFHNSILNIPHLPELYRKSRQLAQIVIAQEYGTTPAEKLEIGKDICHQLIKKISSDLKHSPKYYTNEGHILDANCDSSVSNPCRRVRTRLYFTSESHIYGLMNIFRYGGLFEKSNLDSQAHRQASAMLHACDEIGEYDFLSSILIMQYEDCLLKDNDPNRFIVEIFFSPGNKRSQPITKLKELARPSINKSHKRSMSYLKRNPYQLESSDEKILSKDNSEVSNEKRASSSIEVSSLFIKPISELTKHRSQSLGSDDSLESMTQAINQLRKPYLQVGHPISQQYFVTNSLYALKSIGLIVPRTVITGFLDSMAGLNS